MLARIQIAFQARCNNRFCSAVASPRETSDCNATGWLVYNWALSLNLHRRAFVNACGYVICLLIRVGRKRIEARMHPRWSVSFSRDWLAGWLAGWRSIHKNRSLAGQLSKLPASFLSSRVNEFRGTQPRRDFYASAGALLFLRLIAPEGKV